MTRAFRGTTRRLGRNRPRFWQSGFSLIEVVVATGLCTYALVVIACLLPMGLGTVQIADSQIVETEIFNRIWLEVQTIPYYDLPTFQRFNGGKFPDSSASTGLSYFDKDGGEIGGLTAPTTPPASAVYKVYCTLIYPGQTSGNLPPNINATLISRLSSLGPAIDAGGLQNTSGSAPILNTNGSIGAGLVLVRIDIGFHIDPSTLTGPTDTRVNSRTYVVSKRDTQDGT
jgi:uncharacterized protein (TIGR02598 family)